MSPEPFDPRRFSTGRTQSWRIPLLLIVLAAAVAFYQWHLNFKLRPLTYRIGTVDARFGMSREAFSDAVAQAVSMWKQAVPGELFREAPAGVIEVNLVYDYRQESADRMKALTLKIDDSKGSYESLKAHFETLKAEADQKGAAISQDFTVYNARVSAFNAQGEAARRTPVSESAYRRLEVERSELAEAKKALALRQDEMRELSENLKSLASVLNDFAANHNLELVDYRQAGDRLGAEFSEGEYVQDRGRRSITIYHFPSPDGLVRVLAHEFGHAKGLSHLENPESVMHRLMRTESLELTPDDIKAMQAKVRTR